MRVKGNLGQGVGCRNFQIQIMLKVKPEDTANDLNGKREKRMGMKESS